LGSCGPWKKSNWIQQIPATGFSLLTKIFSKFLRKKSRNRNQQKRRYPKPNDSNSSKYTCFGCGKTGHIKTDCLDNQAKDKSVSKRVKRSKGRRAYISWEENEVSSTSSSSIEDEETICAS